MSDLKTFNSQARLTISSPLEAHKSSTLVYHCVGVDVGFENPMFACLEVDYEEADNDPTGEAAAKTQQALTFYELDLGKKGFFIRACLLKPRFSRSAFIFYELDLRNFFEIFLQSISL